MIIISFPLFKISFGTRKQSPNVTFLICQEIARKRRGKLIRGVLLLLDNAPAHTSQVAMTAATECGFEILPHPSYSPDMAPSDFFLFPKLKSHLRGTQYASSEGVIEAVIEFFGDQEKAFYFEGIRKLKQRWAKCIALKGNYIEKKWSIFYSMVVRSTCGRERFDHLSYKGYHQSFAKARYCLSKVSIVNCSLIGKQCLI